MVCCSTGCRVRWGISQWPAAQPPRDLCGHAWDTSHLLPRVHPVHHYLYWHCHMHWYVWTINKHMLCTLNMMLSFGMLFEMLSGCAFEGQFHCKLVGFFWYLHEEHTNGHYNRPVGDYGSLPTSATRVYAHGLEEWTVMCHLSIWTSPGTCNVCRAITAIASLCSCTMQSIHSDSLAAVSWSVPFLM